MSLPEYTDHPPDAVALLRWYAAQPPGVDHGRAPADLAPWFGYIWDKGLLEPGAGLAMYRPSPKGRFVLHQLDSEAGRLAEADKAAPQQAPADPQYVTLDQLAAAVGKSKSWANNLKARKENPLPPPDIEGGGGRADEWEWSRIRPWLVAETGRRLPEHFPHRR
jgi:hypothetical protein